MAAPTASNTGVKDEDDYHPYKSDIEDARIWMRQYIKTIRDCRYYEEEYKDCRSYRGKFNSYYTYGEQTDCEHWNNAFEHCKKVKSDNDEEALDLVVEHELVRRDFRLQTARNNDVWDYRSTPPEDWKHTPPRKAKPGQSNQNDTESAESKDESEKERQSLTDRAKQEVAKLQEDLFTSKPKVNPKYDDTVQRCTIL